MCIQKLEKPYKTEGKELEEIFMKEIITLELSLELGLSEEGLSLQRRVDKDPQGERPARAKTSAGQQKQWV